MKKRVLTILALSLAVIFCLSGCSGVDKNYGESEPEKVYGEANKNVKIPEIKSTDRVMSTFFDISLYDEENYADIYLGKDFKYKVTYSGGVLNMPSSYKEMVKNSWTLVETAQLKSDSKIMAGETVSADFKDSYGKKVTAVFYNKSTYSESLVSCPIVKFIIEENYNYKAGSAYGQFWVNGVTNESAITDVIECLGAPSHFYAVDSNNYYLDYYISSADKRSKITVYIDIENDCVSKIEFSLY